VSVNRFKHCGDGGMVPTSFGSWVEYDDHFEALQRISQLENALRMIEYNAREICAFAIRDQANAALGTSAAKGTEP
jgi:hypothetical protein